MVVPDLAPAASLATKRPPPQVQRPMDRREIADAIAAIKEQVRNLRPPLNMHPNAFHEDKSDLVRAAIWLEEAVRGNRPLNRDGT
jgi:hypothetical protein